MNGKATEEYLNHGGTKSEFSIGLLSPAESRGVLTKTAKITHRDNGFAPRTPLPKSDENGENGWCHPGKASFTKSIAFSSLTWDGSNASAFRFRRFPCEKGFAVFFLQC